MTKRIISVLLLAFIALNAVPAQETDAHKPVEYEKDEFPQWLKDIRRGEIIAVGAFPFAFFAVDSIFGLFRFAINDFSSAYSPGFFFSADSATPYTMDEKTAVLLISIAASIGVSLVDFFLGAIEK